ncbi:MULTISPECIES: NADPH:quinone oxidoreductase family protein [unclassified Mesorhizobium]|uniref:NADPH:quinone oxidoreductase family protein n=1 Tax=unclassified Mesorhizobium TaxID=325217 RepID=UPI002415BD89|nr:MULTISPECIES: NADPH:quinone oxidoreductase family protein [unclassified Mesorhizobium]WFP65571.1 NADPH:quinone oxidoreductase family protein [Mesorhizobium sp. WSM4904]WFP78836.1 NADPH:quinone oxidoreductase family protein [Mesorhizobium sp. WSM4906]
MKAVWVTEFAPFEQVRVADVPDPVAGPGEVVIEVQAAEANYPDILAIEGRYQIKPPLPFSPGKCAAGVVSSIGAGVASLSVGQRVAAQTEYGAYAQKLRVREESCFVLPEGMPFAKAASLGLVYQTAWFALQDRASFKAGESVLVLGGSGGIGVASIQLAKALGASTVIAGIIGPGNDAIARQAGADAVINLCASNLQDALRDQVKELTGGNGVDIVIDPVGGDSNAAALRSLAWCGRLVIIGFASGTIPTIKANYLLVKNIAVTGLQWSDYRERTPERVKEAQEQISSLFMAGKIDPIISREFALEEFAEGLRLLRDGKAQGKIVLNIGSE